MDQLLLFSYVREFGPEKDQDVTVFSEEENVALKSTKILEFFNHTPLGWLREGGDDSPL